uniref:Uncharacterized protein n=1 Tax=Oryza nivara TaxID=4536 RepID=A0A0E0I9A7_ORYNI
MAELKLDDQDASSCVAMPGKRRSPALYPSIDLPALANSKSQVRFSTDFLIVVDFEFHRIEITITMRFVSAYLMAYIGGNESPSKDDVRAILGSVGADVDEAKLDLLFEEIAGKDIPELIAAGRERLALAAPCGGVAAAAAGGQAVAAGGAAAAAEEEAEEEEKKKEEEDDDDGLFNLFD